MESTGTKKLTLHQQAFVRDSYTKMTAAVMAVSLKIPRTRILAFMAGEGLSCGNSVPDLHGSKVAEIRERFTQTCESPAEIAASMGLEENSVGRWVGANLASLQVAQHKIILKGDAISGMTVTEISSMCSLPYKVIHKLLQKLDIRPAKRRLEFSRVSDGERFLKVGEAEEQSPWVNQPHQKLGLSLWKYDKMKEAGRIAIDELGGEYVIEARKIDIPEDPLDFLCRRVLEIEEHQNQLTIDARALQLTRNALDGEKLALLTTLKSMGIKLTVKR